MVSNYLNNHTIDNDMEKILSAIVRKEGTLYVARGVEIELASQGTSVDEALANLKEAFELWLEHADPDEKTQLNKDNPPIVRQITA